MRNSNVTYLLLDTATKTILAVNKDLDTINFLQRHTVGSNVISMPTAKWSVLSPQLVSSMFGIYVDVTHITTVAGANVTQAVKDKVTAGRWMAQAYEILQYHANLATERTWPSQHLGFADLEQYVRDPAPIQSAYAAAFAVSQTAAALALDMDRTNLQAALARRRQIFWQFEAQALAITNQTQLDAFGTAVRASAVQ